MDSFCDSQSALLHQAHAAGQGPYRRRHLRGMGRPDDSQAAAESLNSADTAAPERLFGENVSLNNFEIPFSDKKLRQSNVDFRF